MNDDIKDLVEEQQKTIAALKETLDHNAQILEDLRKRDRLQDLKIQKLSKASFALVVAVGTFWFLGDRLQGEGAVTTGEIIQLVTVIAGVGGAATAVAKPELIDREASQEL